MITKEYIKSRLCAVGAPSLLDKEPLTKADKARILQYITNPYDYRIISEYLNEMDKFKEVQQVPTVEIVKEVVDEVIEPAAEVVVEEVKEEQIVEVVDEVVDEVIEPEVEEVVVEEVKETKKKSRKK